MTELTKTNATFQWTEDAQASLKNLKQAFCEAPLLLQFQPEKDNFVETDSSNFAISGILSQKDAEGHKHPVAFYSRKMTAPERNYSTPDQELLAVVASF